MGFALHGVAGGWDELLIAVVAFGVMWIAVKLAGRRPAKDDADEAEQDGSLDAEDTLLDADAQPAKDPVEPAVTKRS